MPKTTVAAQVLTALLSIDAGAVGLLAFPAQGVRYPSVTGGFVATRLLSPSARGRRYRRLIRFPLRTGWFPLRKLQPSAPEAKLGNLEDWESVSEPLEVTAVSRIRGTQGIQEETKGHDELGE